MDHSEHVSAPSCCCHLPWLFLPLRLALIPSEHHLLLPADHQTTN